MLSASDSSLVQGLVAAVLATVGAIGFDDTTWSGVPLPVDLTPAGLTNCLLWIDPAITQVLPQAIWSIAVPNDPSLVGAELFAQAFCLLPAANPAGILASNGVAAILGS